MSFKKLFHYPPAAISQYYTSAVLIFGFLFLLAGSVLLVRIPYLFYQKSRLESGIQVPAKILWVKNVASSRRRSTTYVNYEFKINDQAYRGNRVSIFSQPRDIYSFLLEARESGREVICYVDPKDPNFSALNKDVDLFDVFACVVLGIPCFLIGSHQLVGFFIAAKKRSSQSELSQRKRKS